MKIIQHSKNRFEVTGMIYSDVVRGKMEKYSRVHATFRTAKIDCDRWDRINFINAKDHVDITERRRQIVAEYLGKRAERQSATRSYYVVIQTAGVIWDGHADSAEDAAKLAFAAEWDPESMRYSADKTKPALVFLHSDGESVFQKSVDYGGIKT